MSVRYRVFGRHTGLRAWLFAANSIEVTALLHRGSALDGRVLKLPLPAPDGRQPDHGVALAFGLCANARCENILSNLGKRTALYSSFDALQERRECRCRRSRSVLCSHSCRPNQPWRRQPTRWWCADPVVSTPGQTEEALGVDTASQPTVSSAAEETISQARKRWAPRTSCPSSQQSVRLPRSPF